MERMKFAIIGIGIIARVHAEAINSIETAQLSGCFHKDRVKAEKFAKDFHTTAYTDFEALLDSKPDVLVLTTPSAIRTEYAIPAMKRGIHVIVEKPMDTDLERALLMAKTAEEHKVKFAVIFQNRFSPLNVEIAKAVKEGRLGKRILTSAYAKLYRSQEYYDSAAWRGTKAIDGGGCLMNQTIHQLDLIISLSSPIKEVQAFASTLNHERIEVEDTLVANLAFEDGSFGGFEASTAAYPGCSRRLELIGTEGSIVAEDDRLLMWEFRNEKPEDKEIREKFKTSQNIDGVYNHRAQFLDFIDAVKNDRKAAVDAIEGLKSLRVTLAIYESAEKKERVVL